MIHQPSEFELRRAALVGDIGVVSSVMLSCMFYFANVGLLQEVLF